MENDKMLLVHYQIKALMIFLEKRFNNFAIDSTSNRIIRSFLSEFLGFKENVVLQYGTNIKLKEKEFIKKFFPYLMQYLNEVKTEKIFDEKLIDEMFEEKFEQDLSQIYSKYILSIGVSIDFLKNTPICEENFAHLSSDKVYNFLFSNMPNIIKDNLYYFDEQEEKKPVFTHMGRRHTRGIMEEKELVLDLSNQLISDYSDLRWLMYIKNLKEVSFENTIINQEVIYYISHLDKLSTLNIINSNVNDSYLYFLLFNKRLNELFWDANPEITDKGIQVLDTLDLIEKKKQNNPKSFKLFSFWKKIV